jgi:hypothetical protein
MALPPMVIGPFGGDGRDLIAARAPDAVGGKSLHQLVEGTGAELGLDRSRW